MFGLFHLFDNAHLQYEMGFVPEAFWAMTRENLKLQMTNPFSRRVFLQKADDLARPSFRDVILAVDAELVAR